MKSISVPSPDVNDVAISGGNIVLAAAAIPAPIAPAIAPLTSPAPAVLAASATVPPAATLIAVSTTVLNIAALPMIPRNAGPPTPNAPILIVMTSIIIPLNAAISSSFSSVSAPFCIDDTIVAALEPAGSGSFATKVFNFAIGTALPTFCRTPFILGLPVILLNKPDRDWLTFLAIA